MSSFTAWPSLLSLLFLTGSDSSFVGSSSPPMCRWTAGLSRGAGTLLWKHDSSVNHRRSAFSSFQLQRGSRGFLKGTFLISWPLKALCSVLLAKYLTEDWTSCLGVWRCSTSHPKGSLCDEEDGDVGSWVTSVPPVSHLGCLHLRVVYQPVESCFPHIWRDEAAWGGEWLLCKCCATDETTSSTSL